MKGTLYVVGVGPGDPELLTMKAVRVIRNADIIAFPSAGNGSGVARHIAEQAIPEIRLITRSRGFINMLFLRWRASGGRMV